MADNMKISEAEHDTSIGGGEKFPLDDAGTAKYATTGDLKQYVIDQIEALTAASAIDTSADSLYLLQSGALKPISAATVADAVLDYGFGKTAASSVTGDEVVAVDVDDTKKTITATQLKSWIVANFGGIPWSDLTAETTIDDGDYLVFRDTSASADKKILISSFNAAVHAAFKAYVLALSGIDSTIGETVNDTDVVYLVHNTTANGTEARKLTIAQLKGIAGIENGVTGPADITSGTSAGTAATTEGNIPQWDSTVRKLKDGLGVVTTIDSTVTDDTSVATAKATKTYVDAQVSSTGIVKTTTAQSIAGVKTFTDKPIVPDLLANDAGGTVANKNYVDAKVAGSFVDLSSDQSIGGVKTFAQSPKVPSITANSDSASAVPKEYVDETFVDLSSTQTVAGQKTFSTAPLVSATIETTDSSTSVSTTAWVVAKLASWWSSICAAAQSISGVWTFGASPVLPSTMPTTDYQAVPKKYADDNFVDKTNAQTVAGVKTFSDKPIVPDIAQGDADGTVANKKYVDDTLVEAENCVLLDTDQTIAGVKTFSDFPTLPSRSPSNDTDAATKKYVDDNASVSRCVTLTGNQTVAGVKTFENPPVVSATPNADGQLANKEYVDATADACVKLTGDQTVAGVKTFSSIPVLPSTAPTANYQAATKKYVDDTLVEISNCVLLDTNQTIADTKTFTSSPMVPTIGYQDNSQRAASTAYVRAAIDYYSNRVHEPRFPIVALTATNNAVTLVDAAINKLSVAVGSTIAVTMPTATANPTSTSQSAYESNFSRSFVLVLTTTGLDAGSITLNLDSTCTYYAEQADTFILSQGTTHVFGFTERTSGVFAVSKRVFNNAGTAFTGTYT